MKMIRKYLRFYRTNRILQREIKKKGSLKILDVACGNGRISKEYESDKRFEFHNIDILESGELKNYHKLDLEKEEMPFKNKEFDINIGLEIIEHLDYPEQFLEKNRTVLKDDGSLILSTPNIRFLKWILTLLFKGRFPNTSSDNTFYDSGHRKYYTLKDLEILADKTGFYIEEFYGLTSKEFYDKWKFVKFLFGKRFFVLVF
ncbi:MAG: hypothetical protein C0601_10450 [Candidatus Muiribacterium halophilum]|uniref:Class I SAM-dependent methyltransferase n=1 Tax=Muiribacterium halophilum TaxID=2053465 RepID=A0A2N5ZCI9_MUIH1|nr:MAG: hypothetical protein C0601_10450 [Candidatus Muirbacterium halophilum]